MGPAKGKAVVCPCCPLRGLLVYPSMVLHLDVGREKSVKALDRAMLDDHMILLCSQSEVNIEEPARRGYLPYRHDRPRAADAEAAQRNDSCSRGRRHKGGNSGLFGAMMNSMK